MVKTKKLTISNIKTSFDLALIYSLFVRNLLHVYEYIQ